MHYTTLPRNTHMSKTAGKAMRLPLENGGHDRMLATIARQNTPVAHPNGFKVL